jgi:hypothetical protein
LLGLTDFVVMNEKREGETRETRKKSHKFSRVSLISRSLLRSLDARTQNPAGLEILWPFQSVH